MKPQERVSGPFAARRAARAGRGSAAAEPAHERRCYYYLGGFEPRWRALSPGTLLIGHAIEQAIAEGMVTFDFVRGSEAYKYRWGAVDQPMRCLRLWHGNAARPNSALVD